MLYIVEDWLYRAINDDSKSKHRTPKKVEGEEESKDRQQYLRKPGCDELKNTTRNDIGQRVGVLQETDRKSYSPKNGNRVCSSV